MLKRYLLTPGPTAVPPEVFLRMSQPLIHHRTPEFEALFAQVQEKLQWLFQTTQDVLILAASGTGAMEAAVANLTSPGDKVLVVTACKFGERWEGLAKAYNCELETVRAPYGETVALEQIKEKLKP